MMKYPQLTIVGAGAFGTAFASKLAQRAENRVILLGRDPAVISEVNSDRLNTRYLGNVPLSRHLHATLDPACLEHSELVFLALPSAVIGRFMETHAARLRAGAIIANLAKGFVSGQRAFIADHLRAMLAAGFGVATVKGPTFSVELLSALRSAFTVAVDPTSRTGELLDVFEGTGILVDQASSLREVECLSVLKNVYAIALGIVEARYSNPNLQAVILTRAILEIRDLAAATVGHDVDVLKYCGVGDFLLTSLNDQSRNRTLGLMIGKGFLDLRSGTHSVIVEGLRSIEILVEGLGAEELHRFRILSALCSYMRGGVDLNGFVGAVLA